MQLSHVHHRLWFLAALALLDGCATTETASTATSANVEQTPRRRRRRRRRRPVTSDSSAIAQNGMSPLGNVNAAPADGSGSARPAGTFGSAIVVEEQRHYEPRWIVEGSRARIVCEGAPLRAPVISPQSPNEPESAMIVRALQPLEARVLACNPPADNEGRLPVRATFSSAGALIEASFPRVEVSEETALCLGRALCDARMANFRTPEATVNYEYVVMLPEGENEIR